jgi:hypothetical protein
VETGDELTVGPERVLFRLDVLRPVAGTYEVSPDGQRFYLLSQPEESATDRRIVYIPRWTDALDR